MNAIVPQKAPQNKPHYTYTLAYPESMGGHVFYVGKGKGNRIIEHEQRIRNGTPRQGDNGYKEGVIRKIWNAGEEVVRTKLAYFATNDEALEYETALIFFMKGYEHLTNLSDGGDSDRRFAPGEGTLKKLKAASTGRRMSPETRQRMSEAAKKRGFTAEHRRKIGESQRGKKTSEETRRKMSETHLKQYASAEYRQEMNVVRKERGTSEETRRKLSEKAKNQWARWHVEHQGPLNQGTLDFKFD